MSDNLSVAYQTLEASAQRSDQTAQSFGDQLRQLENSVKAMQWQGQSGSAFQGYFDMLHKQLLPVQDTLHGLANQIRSAATNLQDSDQAVARAFQS